MERVDNQAKGKVPAAGTTNRSNRQIREDDPAVKVPVRVKAGAAVADRDRAAARDVVAVEIVQLEFNPNKEQSQKQLIRGSGMRGVPILSTANPMPTVVRCRHRTASRRHLPMMTVRWLLPVAHTPVSVVSSPPVNEEYYSPPRDLMISKGRSMRCNTPAATLP
jgi:hypothetical protein